MIVRPMELRDVETVLAYAEEMHASSPVYSSIPFSAERVKSWLLAGINSPERFFSYVAEREGRVIGGMLAFAAEFMFSEAKYAAENNLFVTPDHRGGRAAVKLVEAFEAWAESLGCIRVTAGVTVGINNEVAEALYTGLGYTQIGKIYHKEF